MSEATNILPDSRTDDDLRKLALAITEGQVFGTWNLREIDQSILSCVFMPLALMNEEQRDELLERDIAHLFAYMKDAGPRAINGYPMFLSFEIITKDDWKKLVPMIKEIEEFRQRFTSGSSSG